MSVNDFIIRAAGQALRDVPGVNAQLQQDGSVKQLDTVDISVAVATPTGLITPIVTNADARTVSSISSSIKVKLQIERVSSKLRNTMLNFPLILSVCQLGSRWARSRRQT